MNSEKLKYTGWLYLIGILGLIFGAEMCILAVLFSSMIVDVRPIILGAFLLPSAILFLLVKREMTYLMFTGMFAILCVFRTFYPVGISGYPDWMAFPYWLCLGYLIYKYFDFRKIFAEKTAFEERTYEKRYEKPYKREKEAKTEAVPYYYRVLGVSKDATPEEIKSVYRRLAKIYHPDRGADPDTEKKFKEIQKAYAVLSDSDKRAQYDRFEDSYSE
ncbi:Chaperone protein DnaJ [ANME-1 cluster archaeon GoMg1]|nr:Chaperone protein DnaJ [ANME-1 cluster archaeon GoMg1]